MSTYRLTLEYDGSDFEGWQVQAEGRRTVQGVLEAALFRVTRECVRCVGAGRTDAGVHAAAQVAHVVLATDSDPERLCAALNGVLPGDVAVSVCERVPEGFHARFGATGKLYRYTIWNGPVPSPLRAARCHWVRPLLDLASMQAAASLLVGTHDFAAFQNSGSDVATSVRTLRRADVLGTPGADVAIELEGPGFLRHMVRIVAGSLVEVGLGRRQPASLTDALAGRNRGLSGTTAPARALTLVRVDFDAGAGTAAGS
ncbi:MAG: tRNA pseudouridine(38-40) synthase TruA [Myxococcota bacterium]|nr:tRNA pseudouridine(38-40) synthase TruA [Deltaproteobacteria bacterium]MCP4240481.1 tRNA pseudouridine(38-40) synthase TruA [bacterium]MDP6076453.1 tRNA pseudouridine(38-40) synthase TruA [Myxococcota bacterium]MDP6244364.1 tRNA pseudouridine(38-40) synthase TruA [Myxococcota bacterium]MDP7073341.1 tRNA pseudouridine(38-40) synthase TruA [Myxococcota bacterium]